MRGKKVKTFNSGDFVFAKLKGFRPWPAKVMLTEGKYKYCVFFYGTEEFSKRLKPANLFDYHQFKVKYGKKDSSTKNRFNAALQEIEAALNGNDIGPAIENFDLDKVLAKSDKCELIEHEVHSDELDFDENSGIEEEETHKPIKVKSEKQAASSVTISQQLKNQDENSNQITKKGRGKRALEDKNDSPAPKRKRVSAKSKQTDFEEPEITVDPVKEKLLEVEVSLFNLHLQIIKYLGPHHKPNTKACIKSLEQMKELSAEFTQIMLKKNPNCVETVKKLKFYVPDTDRYKMKENEKIASLEAAKKIRELAEEIYEKIKEVFNFQNREEEDSFWIEFEVIVDTFREETDKFDDKFVDELCFEEEMAQAC